MVFGLMIVFVIVWLSDEILKHNDFPVVCVRPFLFVSRNFWCCTCGRTYEYSDGECVCVCMCFIVFSMRLFGV